MPLSEDPKISSLLPTFLNLNALLHSFTCPCSFSLSKGCVICNCRCPSTENHYSHPPIEGHNIQSLGIQGICRGRCNACNPVTECDQSLIIQFMSEFNTTNPPFFFFLDAQCHCNHIRTPVDKNNISRCCF